MARLCCPGREGGRQVAVLLKATRTAFERGAAPAFRASCSIHVFLPAAGEACAVELQLWS